VEAVTAAEEATRLDPDSARARRARLKMLQALAERRSAQGDRKGSAEAQQRVIAEYRRSVERDPADAVAQRDLATALVTLAKELSAIGQRTEALAAVDEARAALEAVREHDESGQVRRDLIVVAVREGYVSLAAKDAPRAARAFARARELGTALLAGDEKNTSVLDAMVDAANGLGEAALITGELARARREADEAYALNERLITLAGSDDARLESRRGFALALLGRVRAAQGERQEGCEAAKQALAILEPMLVSGRASASAVQESLDQARAVREATCAKR
jgi:tetratricopeptide (TPR) repeat protein